ncbi:MAG: DUF423 domain-containing protein [Steroidobacteraceae bacterium]
MNESSPPPGAAPQPSGPSAERGALLARRCIAGGALLLLLSVVLGAFGAHALQSMLTPKQLASYQTGVTYQQLHALGLVVLGIVAQVTGRSAWLARGAVLFLAGTVFFSGSIYALAFGAPRWLGMVAPVGGLAFMAGWGCLALHARRVLSPSLRAGRD